MNIDRINELRAFYAAQTQHMRWSSYDAPGSVCAAAVLSTMLTTGSEAGINGIQSALDIPYELAYALFWLKEPGGQDYLFRFCDWHITKQRSFLEAALRGLIEKGELHFDPVEWPA